MRFIHSTGFHAVSSVLVMKTPFSPLFTTNSLFGISRQEPGLKIDLAARRVWVVGQEINPPLSLAQYSLLELLYQNAGNVVSRDDVVSVVWSEEEAEGVSEQAIDALARRLRERIADIDPNNKYVETVRGHGFRLNLADK